MSTQPGSAPSFPVRLDYLCSYNARLSAPEVIGPVPGGIRVNFYILGGDIEGPKLRGRLRGVGGDWLTIRDDGVGILDVRTTMESHDGAVIEAEYTGVGDLGPQGQELFLNGDLPKVLPLRCIPRVRTSHPDYAWLNRLQLLNIGEVNFSTLEVRYDVYAVC